jgi:tRNA(fMet)-specific endonuclease VapC
MLDTDIASYIIKRRSPAIQAKLSEIPPSHVCISVVTRAELLYGLKRLPPAHRLHLAVKRFLRQVQTLSWDAEAADYYADICHQLVSSGQPIGELDMMIAAHSLSANAVLVTNNTRHYKRIEAPLTLVNWAEVADEQSAAADIKSDAPDGS